MLPLRTLATAATATFGLVGCAQTPVDHAAHPPDAAATTGMPMPMGGPGAPMARMDGQMKTMQAMHDKMMQAKTPEQRSALMPEHMKVMQDSMVMMGSMGSGAMMGKGGMGAMGADKGGAPGMQGKGPMDGDMGMHYQMMDKRMQMMQSMMQMMMDRMPAVPGKP